jgi:mannobiose 2-epimerase
LTGLQIIFAQTEQYKNLANEMESSLKSEILDIWYPLCLDWDFGGYLTDFNYKFRKDGSQDKMLVTQARHLWTLSEAALYYKDDRYRQWAEHGYKFLAEKMWDDEYGGFFDLINRKGQIKNDGSKSAYANAFAIYGLASYFKLSGDSNALALANKTFRWLEKYSHDPKYGGYYNNLQRDGLLRKYNRPGQPDQKDQNSSIHLLEALTNLYSIYQDSLVKKRLTEMFVIIRDTIIADNDYLTLFMQRDWTPISLKNLSESEYRRQYYFDHVSFGHDVETSYLLLEALHLFKQNLDEKTLTIAKKMVDQAVANGWDNTTGGFFDAGYYFNDSDTITIINDKKIWWVQAEGLNALLLMSGLYPEQKNYFQRFTQQWRYINTYMIDHEYGGWFGEGLDNSPGYDQRKKGYDWKGDYHNFRAMLNCIKMLRGESELLN